MTAPDVRARLDARASDAMMQLNMLFGDLDGEDFHRLYPKYFALMEHLKALRDDLALPATTADERLDRFGQRLVGILNDNMLDTDEMLEALSKLASEMRWLANTAPTAAGAAEPGNAATTANAPAPIDRWWHLPEFGPFMEPDTEGQRDNSYGPFDTREEAQADWLKIISSPPPDDGGAVVNDDERTIGDIRRELAEARRELEEARSVVGDLEDELWEAEHPDNSQPEPEAKP